MRACCSRQQGPPRLRTHPDLQRLTAGGVDAQFFSIWPSAAYYDADDPRSGRSLARANDMIDAVEGQLARHAGRLELARSSADIRWIAAEGKIATLLGVEGGHAIEHDLPNLTAELLARGYADGDVRKVLGENLMRVLDGAWGSR